MENKKQRIKETINKAKLEITQKIKKVKDNTSNNYLDYLKYYGYNTFEDKPFNEVDNLILATLSYVDFNDLVSPNEKNKKTIDEIKYFNSFLMNLEKIILEKDASKLNKRQKAK